MLQLFILLLSVLPSFAEDIPAPPYNCDYASYRCPTEMKRIADEFKYGSMVDHQMIPQVYSGVCYHHSSMYNPTHPHYGVMVIAQKNDDLYFGGRFVFFARENPYSSWSVDTALQELGARLFDENHKILYGHETNFIRMNEPKNDEPLIYYWLRQNLETRKIYLMGFMGVKNGIFCEYSANP
ncbi:MAG: hypothetical protein M9962_08490 [Oligoflexia bacterium]|nr:hypothetical protein [Oligoflexia bacterium]